MCAAPQTELFPAIEPSSSEVPSETKPEAPCPARPASARLKPKPDQSDTAPRRTPKRTDYRSAWMTVREVAAFFAVSVPTIWRWNRNNPAFPKGHELSPGTTRWYREEIERHCLKLRGVTS